MIPARFEHIVFGFFLSGLMSCLVSGISTFLAAGWVDGFLSVWVKGWLPSWCVAFPAVLIVVPIARRLVKLAIRPD